MRSIRRSFERQLSDKHLKRRIQLQNSSNRKFLYEDPLATIRSASSQQQLQQQQQQQQQHLHDQSQYEWHRCCPDTMVLKHRRKRHIFLLLAILLLVFLFALPTIWYSTLQSNSTIETLPGLGGLSSEDSGSGDGLRSYQDLADSIKRLRLRREARITKDDDDDDGDIRANNNKNNNNIDDQEELRLKRLEQKVQREQNKKVRHELDDRKSYSEDAKTRQQQQQQQQSHGDGDLEADRIALKNKVMSENIEALKLFNQNHKND